MDSVTACMLPRWLAVGAVVVALATLGLYAPTPASRQVEPGAASRVAQPPTLPPDTLRAEGTTGAPLILSLPAQVGGAPVARYSVLRGPSLCGVADRSFTWVTTGSAPGTYDIRLHAHRPDARPDTLVLRVNLTE